MQLRKQGPNTRAKRSEREATVEVPLSRTDADHVRQARGATDHTQLRKDATERDKNVADGVMGDGGQQERFWSKVGEHIREAKRFCTRKEIPEATQNGRTDTCSADCSR